jgi:uncharacterized protein YyaL (SSP411 family)
VIDETLEFIKRELLDESGGFYAALDADSEGEEGKYYVWQLSEVTEILGDDAGLFCSYYDVSEKGNWEGKNILRVKKPSELFARENNIDPLVLKEKLKRCIIKLLAIREKRTRPLLDDKIILGWTALMNTAVCKAFAATGNTSYRELAERNMQFLLNNLKEKDSSAWKHTWKNGQAKYPAFLDDYAFLAEAMLHLQEITADTRWLIRASEITTYVKEHFQETDTGFFFYTPTGQQDVIVRKKEVYDGATPSGNSVMAYNLHRLGILLNKPEWTHQAQEMLFSLGKAVTRYPTSFGNWVCLLQEVVNGTNEIAIVGTGFSDLLAEVLGTYIPHRVLMAAEKGDSGFPLFEGRTSVSKAAIYLCRNYTCKLPVFSANELIMLINSEKNR